MGKRCGTCRWSLWDDEHIGRCNWVVFNDLPYWVHSTGHNRVAPDFGEGCRAWNRRKGTKTYLYGARKKTVDKLSNDRIVIKNGLHEFERTGQRLQPQTVNSLLRDGYVRMVGEDIIVLCEDSDGGAG